MKQLLTIHGYWKDTKEPITRLCSIDSRIDPNHSDHQQFLWDLDNDDDNDIFYYFEPDEHIIGDKGDFYVFKFELQGE
jgi:hypothetical protein